MPFIQFSRKLARGEKITRADLFDIPIELVIAQFRIVLCVVCLFTVFVDPTPERYASIAKPVVVTYCIFALVVLSIVLPGLPGSILRPLIHLCDLAFVATIFTFVAGGRPNPLVAISAFFLLVAAALRWSWPGVLATALACATTMVGSNALQFAVTSTSERHDWGNAIARVVYLGFAGGMLAYFSGLRERRRSQLTRLADWPGADATHAHSPSLAVILGHCARCLEVHRVLVLWTEAEEPFLNVAVWENGNYECVRRPARTFGDFVRPRQLVERAFVTDDAASGRVLLHHEPFRLNGPIFDENLIRAFRIRSVATAPVSGTFCNGRVFILDRGSWSEFQLLLTELIASRIALELDRHMLQRRNEEAMAARERARFTRDLHDGILQSLTAATIQLKLVSDGSGDDVQPRLDSIKRLLNGVQIQIRNFVRETTQKNGSGEHFVLARDLQRVLSETSKLWDCAISLSVEPQDIRIPTPIAGQLSLMLAEAVSNAARHGQASAVDVNIRKADRNLSVTISDNGSGFEDTSFQHDHEEFVASRGPVSLRGRVSELGGSLEVNSSKAGAELHIRLPLA